MIEIMCRDGSISEDELETAAGVLRGLLDSKVEVLHESEHRAMVFWGPGDVSKLIKDDGIEGLDAEDMNLCDEILQTSEGNIHQAMLQAGYDSLYDTLYDLVGPDPEDPETEENPDFPPADEEAI